MARRYARKKLEPHEGPIHFVRADAPGLWESACAIRYAELKPGEATPAWTTWKDHTTCEACLASLASRELDDVAIQRVASRTAKR